MSAKPSVLIVTTQIWLQITRLAMRLAAHGCAVSVLCTDESHLTYAPGIVRRYNYHLGHPARSLRHAIAASAADYLLPTDDLSVWSLHDLAEDTPSLRPLIERSLGDRQSYPLLRSRFQVLSLARRLGIAIPHTELIEDPTDLRSWCDGKDTAFVMKRDGTWGGSGVEMVHSAAEAHDAYCRLTSPVSMHAKMLRYLRNGDNAAFSRLRCLRSTEVTAQALVQGVPATSMYVAAEGRLLAEVQARVVASKGKTGPSLVVQLIDDARITRAARLLAGHLRLSGCFGLDFMLEAETGEPLLIELNPRSTQLGHLAVANRPDLAGYLAAYWRNTPLPAPGAADLGTSICFYPEGEQWTQKTASLPGCRTDVLTEELPMLAILAAGNPNWKARLRRRVWESLSHLKGSLQSEVQPQAFYYPELGQREPAPAKPAAAPGPKSICIAS